MHIETNNGMTFSNIRTVISETKENCYAFAKEQGFTKQQTIAFAILGIHNKGICIATAVEQVCGKDILDLINEVPYTEHQLIAAVRSSFFS